MGEKLHKGWRLGIASAAVVSAVAFDVYTSSPESEALLQQAEFLLQKEPVSVTTKQQTPLSGDKHDYLSLAPYFWPSPVRLNGFSYINRDGEKNPERDSISDAKNMQDMITWSHTLALAYKVSKDQKYAEKSADFITTWFVDSQTKMNPNMNYAQLIKGREDEPGVASIDGARFPRVIETMEILDASKAMSREEKNEVKDWFGQYLDWLKSSKKGNNPRTFPNNIGTWHDYQVFSIALYVGDQKAARDTIEDVKQRIATQIEPDGKQPFELQRTKSWDYSIYNLEALCNIAAMSPTTGINLWAYETSDGRSIKKAMDFMLPYIADVKKWPYQQIKTTDAHRLVAPLKQAAKGYKDNRYYVLSKEIEKKIALH